jgi:hypothetical protein
MDDGLGSRLSCSSVAARRLESLAAPCADDSHEIEVALRTSQLVIGAVVASRVA